MEIELYGGKDIPPDLHPPFKMAVNDALTNPAYPDVELRFGECSQGHFLLMVISDNAPSEEVMESINAAFPEAEHVTIGRSLPDVSKN